MGQLPRTNNKFNKAKTIQTTTKKQIVGANRVRHVYERMV